MQVLLKKTFSKRIVPFLHHSVKSAGFLLDCKVVKKKEGFATEITKGTENPLFQHFVSSVLPTSNIVKFLTKFS